MNLNTFGGLVKDGDYDVLITHGNAVLSEHATFDTLVVKGILQTGICQGRRIILDGGLLSSSSDIISDSISGHGSIRASASIRSTHVDFIGDLICNQHLAIRERIRVNGLVDTRSFQARNANIIGHINVHKHLEADSLSVQPMHTAMFERFGMSEYLKPNEIEGIEARTVTLSNTICGSIIADTVCLSGNTHARKVLYDDDLKLDRTSSVTVIEHPWKEEDDDGLQRKVA
ncbi:hypothetical protein OZX57_04890 [Bifidobacterium sp. ESL0682]|uniref:hypothetical protein n=1 Tax=Bifidobacterium sp. ESL0682 TaxID=2983212 RepID=UPI0023F845F7|nr:hypothetical protein [Bifidobacterium sp. ESL0682]WEV41396.1 hypothetical protein OZX57_04890 [Bifidobacterium sp. ESL0682]